MTPIAASAPSRLGGPHTAKSPDRPARNPNFTGPSSRALSETVSFRVVSGWVGSGWAGSGVCSGSAGASSGTTTSSTGPSPPHENANNARTATARAKRRRTAIITPDPSRDSTGPIVLSAAVTWLPLCFETQSGVRRTSAVSLPDSGPWWRGRHRIRRAAMPAPMCYVFGLRVATRTSWTTMPMGSLSV